MPYDKRGIGSGVIFLFIVIALHAGSYTIVVTTNDAMGPQFSPRTAVICMGILTVAQAASGLKKERREQGSGERSGFNIRAAVTIGILSAYVLLVQTVGFIIMTAVYFLAQILLLLSEKRLRSGKDILVTVAASVVTPILVYELFYRVFSIFLPTGLLG